MAVRLRWQLVYRHLGTLSPSPKKWACILAIKQLERVKSPARSTGVFSVISGSGTHPPFNARASSWTRKLLHSNESDSGRREALETLFNASNYQSLPYSNTYDLTRFSVEETQGAISHALGSPASARYLSRKYMVPLTDDLDSLTIRETMGAAGNFREHGQMFMKKTGFSLKKGYQTQETRPLTPLVTSVVAPTT